LKNEAFISKLLCERKEKLDLVPPVATTTGPKLQKIDLDRVRSMIAVPV
jgi:hypothetical protein